MGHCQSHPSTESSVYRGNEIHTMYPDMEESMVQNDNPVNVVLDNGVPNDYQGYKMYDNTLDTAYPPPVYNMYGDQSFPGTNQSMIHNEDKGRYLSNPNVNEYKPLNIPRNVTNEPIGEQTNQPNHGPVSNVVDVKAETIKNSNTGAAKKKPKSSKPPVKNGQGTPQQTFTTAPSVVVDVNVKFGGGYNNMHNRQVKAPASKIERNLQKIGDQILDEVPADAPEDTPVFPGDIQFAPQAIPVARLPPATLVPVTAPFDGILDGKVRVYDPVYGGHVYVNPGGKDSNITYTNI